MQKPHPATLLTSEALQAAADRIRSARKLTAPEQLPPGKIAPKTINHLLCTSALAFGGICTVILLGIAIIEGSSRVANLSPEQVKAVRLKLDSDINAKVTSHISSDSLTTKQLEAATSIPKEDSEQEAYCKKQGVATENCDFSYAMWVEARAALDRLNSGAAAPREDTYRDFLARGEQRKADLEYCAKHRTDWSCTDGQYAGQY